MFSENRGATATYRTIARGRGCGWVRSYQASLRMSAERREPAPAAQARGSAGTQATGLTGWRIG
jgi:hypothetical protein